MITLPIERTIKEPVVGIDLGTTCSCVCVIDGDAPKVIENLEGMRTTPSYVTFMEDGTTVVGIAAKKYALSKPEDSFYSLKRIIGRQFDDPVVQDYNEKSPYKIIKGPNGDSYVQSTSKSYNPSEIMGIVLGKMKETAESHIGTQVKRVVIAIPSTFNDAQKNATKDAAKHANLEIMSFIPEPAAAALAYGLDKSEDRLIGVYDFGGGTFDFSVVEITDGTFEVKSIGGEPYLGGEDFDIAIQMFLMKEFEVLNKIDLMTEKQAIQRVREASENAKCELSTALNSQINLPYITADTTGPKHLNYKLTRAKFESLINPLIEKSLQACARVIEEAGIVKEDLTDIILVGGSSKVPKVRDAVKSFFGKEPLREIAPDEAIAMGAALQGGVLTSEVSSVDIIDIVPHSIGLDFNGTMMKLIEASSLVPVNASKVFTTSVDNQREVEITILQGEKELSEENKVIKVLTLGDIPPAPKGVPRIQIDFKVGMNGELRVSAINLATRQAHSIMERGHSKKKVKK